MLSGHGLENIAKHLKLSVVAVRKLAHGIIQDLKDRMGSEFDVQVAQQLGRIEMVEQAAWEAWEASKHKERYEEKLASGGDKGDITTTKKNKEDTPGDPRYLKIAMECIQERSRLLGLDSIPEAGNVDDVPIVAVIVDSRSDRNRVMEVQKFLAVNTVEGSVEKKK